MQDESGTAPKRELRILNEFQIEKYTAMINEYERQYARQESIDNSNEQTYYIVSVKFLQTFRDFCMSKDPERQIPLVMNEDLLQPQTKKLKRGLIQKEDFEILSQTLYNTLSQFHSNPIKRSVVTLGYEKRVPIYLNQYRYFSITSKMVKDVEKILKKKEVQVLSIIQQSQNSTVKQIIDKILKQQEFQFGYEGRLWKIDKKQNIDTFLNHLLRASQKIYSYMNLRVKGFGKKLDFDTKIEDLQMQQGDFFVLQIKQRQKKWFLTAENQKQCQGCYNYSQLKYMCECKNVAYCTEQCLKKDRHYHIRKCEYAEQEQFKRALKMEINEYSRRGRVGLRNLGNTCFMNSCLQCLSNTQPLTQYFLRRLFEPEINKTNPLGTKGKLAKNYALFIKGMWCQSSTVYSPDLIKSAVSSINPMFSGYSQHDSQQFFSFIIDGIHEDLNRVEKKPYLQSIESNNRSQKQVATQSWLVHIRRNQSIITDLMTGQYKSKVTCPTCKKESITFDPFITVTLPISQKISHNFECFVFYKNLEEKTKKINFSYSKANQAQWRKNISKQTNIDQNSLQIFLVTIYEGIYCAARDSLSEIIYKAENESKNIFVFELTEAERQFKERIDIPTRLAKKTYYNSSDYQNIWFKFPLFLEKNSTNGLYIYKRVLKLLYFSVYIKRHNLSDQADENNEKYDKYQQLMLQKRPFKIFLKYNRKIDRHYSRIEFKYNSQIQIQDKTQFQDLWKTIDFLECQIDIRFTQQSLQSQFDMKNLRQFDDLCKKSKSNYYNEDSHQAVELRDCFDNLSEQQELQRGNEWYCSNCKQHKQAKKILQIYKAPKILILHLKRFKNKGSYRKQKNQTKVLFPEVLDMQSFLIDQTPISSYQAEAQLKGFFIPPKYQNQYKISTSQKPIYDLYAISNHYGGLGGGHYTAYAKNGNNWYDFNDSSVRQISKESIQGSSAYMLFYKRRDG